jgi:LacI family transcriptional regulator
MLDGLLRGRKPKRAHRFFPPVRVVARHSTDTLAIKDRLVASVLRLIHDRATTGLTVRDIERHATISRRQIERRFREQLGGTLLEEIRRVKIERAKRLLIETDLDMPRIAAESGFNEARRLSMVFKQQTGQSPSHYRRALRNRPRPD